MFICGFDAGGKSGYAFLRGHVQVFQIVLTAGRHIQLYLLTAAVHSALNAAQVGNQSAKLYAAQTIESVFYLAGCDVEHSDGYPGWSPNPDSKLLATTVECYRKLFATEPKVRAIHAGLECGLFLEKYPLLEMVSFGPTLRGVHSPDERLEIATVDKFWKLLVELMRSLD